MHPLRLLPLLGGLVVAASAAPSAMRFDFGAGPVADGFTPVAPDTLYTPARGHGLLAAQGIRSSASDCPDPLRSDALVSDRAFAFVVDLPPGNYDVTVLLGDPSAPSSTTVKAESRRLMIETASVAAGATESRSFTVNIRTP
ncbi:MAG: hypothetical protein RLZZ50_1547, partial [Verrucomicrobiota bacterium]